ncbi:MAG: mono/diheme cytochrome c family protein [Planctomycetota bacterium]
MKGPKEMGIVAIAVMVMLFCLYAIVTPDLSERNVEFMTEMVYSKANESFSLDETMPNGRTQQDLVEGVVVRGSVPFVYAAGSEEALRAGAELANPFAADDALAMESGRGLYGVYCGLCHDPKGNGRGTVVDHGMNQPPSLHAVRAMGMKDGEMFHILTRGQGNMASYAAQMTREERWQVILYVRQLQEVN